MTFWYTSANSGQLVEHGRALHSNVLFHALAQAAQRCRSQTFLLRLLAACLSIAVAALIPRLRLLACILTSCALIPIATIPADPLFGLLLLLVALLLL